MHLKHAHSISALRSSDGVVAGAAAQNQVSELALDGVRVDGDRGVGKCECASNHESPELLLPQCRGHSASTDVNSGYNSSHGVGGDKKLELKCGSEEAVSQGSLKKRKDERWATNQHSARVWSIYTDASRSTGPAHASTINIAEPLSTDVVQSEVRPCLGMRLNLSATTVVECHHEQVTRTAGMPHTPCTHLGFCGSTAGLDWYCIGFTSEEAVYLSLAASLRAFDAADGSVVLLRGTTSSGL